MKKKIASIAVALGFVTSLGSSTPAHSTDTVITALPGGFLTTYATPVSVVPDGFGVTFANYDVATHDVVATGAYGPPDQPWCVDFSIGRCPLFWSNLIPINETTPVLGLENAVPAKIYDFLCTLHPGMRGKLVVLPSTA